MDQAANNKLQNAFAWIGTAGNAIATFVILGCFCSNSFAKTLNLVVQPILGAKRSIDFYKPLTDYLSKKTGEDIQIIAATNFPAYWETMKKDIEYDIILDAAHFTDFRIKRLGYTVLAKVPDTVSYSLVTHQDELLLDPEELIGKHVATMSSPGLGGIRLAQMFPNPLQQPIIMESPDSLNAVDKVQKGEAIAAIIPTPLLNTLSGLNTVVTTDPVPHVGFSVSPRLSNELKKSLKNALINAVNTKDGQAMLKSIGFPEFVSCNATLYSGYAELLENVWGY
ncbi:MAG: phosphate/phosphite/phosphonate ABC transporter substrate-binding protein [Gammaproteobacteria bacterium]|nr:phosphate/phosphite/phosphonate ABC transporter substrate-binding protein [Gammaproteobacteria bacterium]